MGTNKTKMPIVKLVYFDIQAKGELTRLLLAAGNIDYEDFRVGFSDWPGEIKATTPFGQMPVLYWDGEELAQSMAIARFVARKVGQEPGGAGGVGQGIPHRVHPKVAEASGGDSCQAWQWVVRRHWRHFCRPGHHVRPRLAAGAVGDVLQGHEQRCRAEEDPRRLSSCEGKLPEDQRSAVCGRVEEKEACLCWVLI